MRSLSLAVTTLVVALFFGGPVAASPLASPHGSSVVVAQEEPTCPGGGDGYPECNPQIDAEVNLTADCAARNADGTYTVTGVLSVTNQSEHAQGIRITEVVGPTADSEAFFLGQVIANGATLSYAYQSVWVAGDDPSAVMVVSASVLFESTEGRGTVRAPRGDAEEFYLDGPCAGEEPVEEPTCETDPTLCEPPVEEPTCETDPTLCEPPVEESTCETDPTLCEEPVEESTCETDPTLCEEPVDEEPVDEEPVDEEPVDEEPVDEEPTDDAVAEVSNEPVVALPSTGTGPTASSGGPTGWVAVLLTALLGYFAALGMCARRNP